MGTVGTGRGSEAGKATFGRARGKSSARRCFGKDGIRHASKLPSRRGRSFDSVRGVFREKHRGFCCGDGRLTPRGRVSGASGLGFPGGRDLVRRIGERSGGFVVVRVFLKNQRRVPGLFIPWGLYGLGPAGLAMTMSAGERSRMETSRSHDTNDVLSDGEGPRSLAPGSMRDVGKVLMKAQVPYSPAFPVRDSDLSPKHFRKLKLLGRGGVGEVFLVNLKGTDKLYAMKVLTKEEMIEKNKVQRVLTEREILATANHPFIVTMYASFQTHEKLYFVMDYCGGGEFFRVLQKQPRKRLPEAAAKFYAAEGKLRSKTSLALSVPVLINKGTLAYLVVMALEYLHHMGFIYRDLKPENVLMRSDGHLAVTDFDLSKQAMAINPRVVAQHDTISKRISSVFRSKLSFLMSPEVEPANILDVDSILIERTNQEKMGMLEIVNSEPVLPGQSTSFVGTEEYIAPEVVDGVAQTASVDWWTLGILIYEMLTGTTPFKGKEQSDTFSNICTTDVKFPSDIRMSKEVKSLIRGLLTRDPGKRLGSRDGASEIEKHKWFEDIEFSLIRNMEPPLVPRLKNPLDFSQYKIVEEDDDDSEPVLFDEDNPFQEFDIRRDLEVEQRKY